MTTGTRNDREADGSSGLPESQVYGSIRPAGPARHWRAGPAVFCWAAPLLIALIAAASVLITIDPAGSYPQLPQGPGVTLDEMFNVHMGVYQWHALCDHGGSLWTAPVRDRVFADGPGRPYNPDHPPLGRVWIGFCHDMARVLAPPVETGALQVTACARTASALAFAATVFLVGLCAGRWYGKTAGWAAAISLALMPRVFAHAHLAALETCTSLVFAAAVFYVGDRYARQDPGEWSSRRLWKHATVAGILFGLALLTKIQAVLLPVPISLWLLWRFGWRALVAIGIFGLTGLAVFLLGWPWLWIDPVDHVREYFLRGVERSTLHCYYFGTQYDDLDVPWHYSFILFVLTAPVGLQALGICGLAGFLRRRTASTDVIDDAARARTLLLAGVVLFVLGFFALPGITVYDGARLFLVACPLWAVLCGAGAAWVVDRLARRWSARGARAIVAVFLALQSYGVIALHPCQLSYYNAAVGGLRGASACGMEISYWADSVTRELLLEAAEQIPAGSTIDLAPRLVPDQEVELLLQSPILSAGNYRLRAYDNNAGREIRYVLVYRRRADPWPSLEPAPEGSRLLAEVRRDGVQLAALFELPPPE